MRNGNPDTLVDWLALWPVVRLEDFARQLRATGMPPVVACLTVALIAVGDAQEFIEGFPVRDWEWPMEDFDLDAGQAVGSALNAAEEALTHQLAHYHAYAARRQLLVGLDAQPASAPEGGDHA